MAAIEKTALLPEEDQIRANVYDLLAALLARPPSRALLASCARLEGGEGPVGAAFSELARRAAATDAAQAEREYTDLFIGVGRGELLPYASFYLTGFLNEKPLAALREDMRRLGIARAETSSDPEDHVASLCDMMAGLIRGRYRVGAASLATQREFFDRHLGPWAAPFFADLEKAASARLYAPVGALGAAFVQIEKTGFRLER